MDTLNFRKNNETTSWEIFNFAVSHQITSEEMQFGGSQPLATGVEVTFDTKEELPIDDFKQMGVQVWIDTEDKVYSVDDIDENGSNDVDNFDYVVKSYTYQKK